MGVHVGGVSKNITTINGEFLMRFTRRKDVTLEDFVFVMFLRQN